MHVQCQAKAAEKPCCFCEAVHLSLMQLRDVGNGMVKMASKTQATGHHMKPGHLHHAFAPLGQPTDAKPPVNRMQLQ